MPAKTGPNMGIKYEWDLNEYYKAEMDANLKLLDMINQLGVIDKDLATPPGSPTNGDRYIVGPAATDDWAGHENKIAVYIEAVWEFHIPKLGWNALVLDEGFVYWWGGSAWSILQTPASVSEAVTDTVVTGAAVMDLSTGIRKFRTPGATGGVTLSFSNIPAGVETEVSYQWVQDVVGGRALSFPAGTRWHGGAAPTPSTGEGESDRYLFIIDTAGVIDGNVIGKAYA